MKNLILLLLFTTFYINAKTVKPKIMHGQDYHREYEHSSRDRHYRDGDILCSTSEGTVEISVDISIELSSEVTTEITSGGRHHGTARLSYLDNNRIEIIEDIAKGEGEYLETLLSLMNLKKDKDSLNKIQSNFDELIYLSHNDFLDKIELLLEKNITV